jgi:hypothetical protein
MRTRSYKKNCFPPFMVTDPKTAINIGNVATAALAIHDLAHRPQSLSEGISKGFAAWDLKEGYNSAKELMHEWAQDLYQHSWGLSV